MKRKIVLLVLIASFSVPTAISSEYYEEIVENLDASIVSIEHFCFGSPEDDNNYAGYRYILINRGVDTILSEFYIQQINYFKNEVTETLNITEITDSNIFVVSKPIISKRVGYLIMRFDATNVRIIKEYEITLSLYESFKYRIEITES